MLTMYWSPSKRLTQKELPQMSGSPATFSSEKKVKGALWITSIPAAISGFGGQLGTLAPGAIADVVMWDGDPLEVGSVPVAVFIDGVRQPVENHQTRLRERYRDLDESDLPKAYDW